MLSIRLAFVACTLSLGASAQTITNVVFSPVPVAECQVLDMTIHGIYPSAAYTSTFFTFDTVGQVLNLTFHGDGTGSNPPTPFTQILPSVGPLTAGTWPFVATLYLNGVITDTWTTSITVLPSPPHDPGTDANITICSNAPVFPMTSMLGGTPSPGGQWLDPNGDPHAPTYDPGLDMDGAWIYLFDMPAPCVDTSAQLFITYHANNSAGIDDTVYTCLTGTPVNLFDSLGGTPLPNGVWTGPGSSLLPGGIYDPDLNVAGNYIYSVAGLPPCGDPHATLTVIDVQLPYAGVGGTGQACSNDPTTQLNLFLSDSPDQNGLWYDPYLLQFGLYNAMFNATQDVVGEYLYVTSNAYCPSDTASVIISLVAPCADTTLIDTTGVSELDGSVVQFQLAPNPSDGLVVLHLLVERVTGEHRIDVLNAQGMLVRSEPVLLVGGTAADHALDLSGLARGAYLLRVIAPTGESTARRLVLQ